MSALEERHRQVLGFVATYAAEEGYLPSPSEIALGCGIRSPSTARRAMRELEELGLIRRNPEYPRLGAVLADVNSHDLDIELWVVGWSVHESRGNLEAIRRGLSLAPDLASQEFLYREGSARVTLMRAYLEAQRRMLAAGAALSTAAEAALAGVPAMIDARHALVADWQSYCLYSAYMTWGSHRVLTMSVELGLSHLTPIHHAELDFYDWWTRLDRQVVTPAIHAGDARLVSLAAELGQHLDVVLSAGEALFPGRIRPMSERFRTDDFLASFERGQPTRASAPAR
jgi:hypothetical protein